MEENKKDNWKSKTTKEKLDMVFVIVAIVGFSLSAYVNIKMLSNK